MPFQKGNKGFRTPESYKLAAVKLAAIRNKKMQELGYVNSPETRRKISEANKGRIAWNRGLKGFGKDFKHVKLFGADNPAWRGDDIGYHPRHSRVTRAKGRASEHECFLKDQSCSGKMQWSSISHVALPDIDDYRPLCQSHHARYDDHINKIQRDKKTGRLMKKPKELTRQ